ncbi:ABC transporter permease subunit [Candidatus Gracilibacteria bacterium]|nr:ABC transporter permease subunit [Candidatus Gracilibacteria bacterium]
MAKQATSGPTPTLVTRPVTRSRRLESLLGRDWKVALPFVLPMVVIMAGLILWPFINAILLSFTQRTINRTERFVGLRNYELLFSDADFLSALANTFSFTFYSVTAKLIVGLSIALLLNSRIPFRNILTGLMLLPWIVPEVVTAMAWRSIYDPIFGGLNPILQGLGLIDRKIAWLAEPQLAMPSVIAVNIWKGIPFFTMLLLAGLKAIDQEQYEAAEVDGASRFQRFRHITLPGLRYVIAVTVLLSTISTFNTFGLVYLMTGGGPGGATRLYSILAYEKAIIGLRFGPGAAVALSMAPLLALFILILARFMRRDENAERSDENNSIVDRAFAAFGRWMGVVFNVVMLPIEWLFGAFDALGTQIARLLKAGRPAESRSLPLMNRRQRERNNVIVTLLLLVPFLAFVLFPFYWVFITAFKTNLQIQQFQSIYWPAPWTIEQFTTLINGTPYLTWFRNTVIVATATTVLSVFLAALAGYALARLKFLGAVRGPPRCWSRTCCRDPLLFIPLYRTLTSLGFDRFLWRLDFYLSDVLDAVCNLGDAWLLPLDSGGFGRRSHDRWRNPAWRVLARDAATGGTGAAFRDAVRFHQCLEGVSVRLCLHY